MNIELSSAADLLIAQRGVPPTAENKQRAMQMLATNPGLAQQLHWGTGKSSLPDAMFLGDEFGAPQTMNADAKPSAPTGKDASNAAQAVPPPASSTAPSNTSQQQTGANTDGSPVGVPFIPVPPPVLPGNQAARNAAQGSVDEGMMLNMLSGPNATEQAILQQIDGATQAPTTGAPAVADTTFEPVGKGGAVRDTTTGALYRVVGEGQVLDAANNAVDPETTQRILRAMRGLF